MSVTPRSRTRPAVTRIIAGLMLAALLAAGAGCAAIRDDEGRPLNSLSPKGPSAQEIDDYIVQVFGVAGIIFVLVEGGILFMAWRFRHRKDDDGTMPVQTHGNFGLEIGWTIAPAVILAVLAVGSVRTIWDLEERDADALTVEVIGQQWWWEFRYDLDEDGTPDIITANQMVVPAGRMIDLDLKSNDVIHSFWIPELNGKKDAVPGRTNNWRLEADEPGLYQGTCTEFCGLSHAYMRAEVKALSPADWEQWLEDQQEPAEVPAAGTLAAEGYAEFQTLCASCHQVNGFDPDADPQETDGVPSPDYRAGNVPLAAGNAPNLTHLMSRNRFAGNLFPLYAENGEGELVPNESDLGDWLRNPVQKKPMAPDQRRGMPNLNLTQEQIDALVAYLVTLQ